MPPAARTARDDLIRQLLPSVRRIANKHVRRVTSREAMADDIYSAGLEGLVRGVNRYDPQRGDAWSYISRAIEGGILDFLRDQDHLSRDYRRKAKETGVEAWRPPVSIEVTVSDGKGRRKLTIGDMLTDTAEPVDVTMERWQEAVVVNRAIACLPARTRAILGLYYVDDLNLKEIGAVYGITESRVCQILGEAHTLLRATLTA